MTPEKRNSFLWFLPIFLLIIGSTPYVFNLILGLPRHPFIVLFLQYLVIVIQLIIIGKVHIGHRFIWIVFILEILQCFILSFYHGLDPYYLMFALSYTLTFLTLLVIREKIGFVKFISYYNYWILLMAVGGTITFILALLGVPNFFEYKNIDGNPGYSWVFSCTNHYYGSLVRYSGYFDEPGAMGSWGIFALVFNKLFVGNKRNEYVLIVCLIFTFSAAYYVLLVAYVLAFYMKSFKQLFIVALLIIPIGWALYSTKNSEYDFYKYSFKRFEYNSNKGSFEGDNRSSLKDEAKKYFVKNPIMGVGAKKFSNLPYMSDNPFELLTRDGVFGTFFIYLPLLSVFIYGIIKRKQSLSFSSLILFANYLQRPFHDNYLHYIMLFMFFAMSFECPLKTDKSLS